jgi:hypothetical protein
MFAAGAADAGGSVAGAATASIGNGTNDTAVRMEVTIFMGVIGWGCFLFGNRSSQ